MPLTVRSISSISATLVSKLVNKVEYSLDMSEFPDEVLDELCEALSAASWVSRSSSRPYLFLKFALKLETAC